MKSKKSVELHKQAVRNAHLRREAAEKELSGLKLSEAPDVLRRKREELVSVEQRIEQLIAEVNTLRVEQMILHEAIEILRYRPNRAVGEAHGRAKLSDDHVLGIQRMHTEGLSYDSLAARFLVSKATIAKIIKGQRRRLLTGGKSDA